MRFRAPEPGIGDSGSQHEMREQPLTFGLVVAVHLALVWAFANVMLTEPVVMEPVVRGTLVPPPPAAPVVEPLPLPVAAAPAPTPAPKPVVAPRPRPVRPPSPVAPPSERAVTAPPPAPPETVSERVEPVAEPLPFESPGPASPPIAAVPPAPAAPPAPAQPVVLPRSDAAHLNNPAPAYPSMSRRMGEQGQVQLDVYILPDGSVGEIKLRRSSGHARLDQAALDAVRHWRYQPARRGDQPIPWWYVQPVLFTLG